MNIINFFVNLIKDPRTAIASWIAMGVAPTLGFIFLIVFIESMADFGNPLVLAGAAFPMLAPQAYLEITGSFNLSRGATLAVVLLIPSLTAFAIQRRLQWDGLTTVILPIRVRN